MIIYDRGIKQLLSCTHSNNYSIVRIVHINIPFRLSMEDDDNIPPKQSTTISLAHTTSNLSTSPLPKRIRRSKSPPHAYITPCTPSPHPPTTSQSVMTSIPRAQPLSFNMLKVPLVNDLLAIFQRSDEFKQLQYENKLAGNSILSAVFWQPLVDNIVSAVHACITTKKSALANKQKVLTRQIEEVLVEFVDSHYSDFELIVLADLPGHLKGVIRLHTTNFIRIIKREMCHDITTGSTKLKSIVRHAFETKLSELMSEGIMRLSGRESLYYITGWLLRAALKAAKRREKEVKEQLRVLVVNGSSTRELAVDNNDLPTMKVEQVEKFGGLSYATNDFFVFVQRLEYVFIHTLTPELLMMNGSCLIEMVYGALNEEDLVFDAIAKFCEDNVGVEVISSVVKYITRTYCRMRGKDFARKIMSKNTKSLQ